MGIDPVTATIGSSVIGGVMQSGASSKAAKAQQSAAQQASDTQMAMFNKTQENLSPYMNTGALASNALTRLMGLSPGSGGYDQAAYQNALTQYNAGHPAGGGAQQGGQNGLSVVTGNIPGKNMQQSTFTLSDGRTVSSESANPGDREIWRYITESYGQPGHSLDGTMDLSQFRSSYPENNGGAGGRAPQLSDYATPGGGGDPLNSPLLKAITMDQKTLEQTPGYQFNLSQGLKSTQNAAAARGLGTSGAALKGAAQYATGLADTTYQNQFNNAVTNQTNQFNRLTSVANSGQNAAAGLGTQGTQVASNIGNNMIGAGNAAAGGYMAGAQGISNALSGGSNALMAGRVMDMYSGGSSYNAGAANLGLPWSDMDLKEDIIPMGTENGHNVYQFKYLWSPKKYIGVMAQEVQKTRPEAVKRIGDYLAVDYNKIGVVFREAI